MINASHLHVLIRLFNTNCQSTSMISFVTARIKRSGKAYKRVSRAFTRYEILT